MKLPKSAVIAAVIASSDSTNLSTFSGDVSEHPLYITLGNIPMKMRHKAANEALLCAAMLPSMPAAIGKSVRHTASFRQAKRRLLQDAMQCVMQPLIDVSQRYEDRM